MPLRNFHLQARNYSLDFTRRVPHRTSLATTPTMLWSCAKQAEHDLDVARGGPFFPASFPAHGDCSERTLPRRASTHGPCVIAYMTNTREVKCPLRGLLVSSSSFMTNYAAMAKSRKDASKSDSAYYASFYVAVKMHYFFSGRWQMTCRCLCAQRRHVQTRFSHLVWVGRAKAWQTSCLEKEHGERRGGVSC